jgi:hypothetical protein
MQRLGCSVSKKMLINVHKLKWYYCKKKKLIKIYY